MGPLKSNLLTMSVLIILMTALHAVSCSHDHSRISTEKPSVYFHLASNTNAHPEEGRSKWAREIIVNPTGEERHPIDCTEERECELHDASATFRPFSQQELDTFLKRYAQSKPSQHESDEPKSWQLMEAQRHKRPPPSHDDRNTGWVSLEPIAWSSSQVQKWEPHTKPQAPPQADRWQERPWTRPTYQYRPEPSPQHESWQRPQWGADILTDGKPSGFPDDQPRPSYHRPSSDPPRHSDGEGQWVLLSSTKGYSWPRRDRALKAPAVAEGSVTSHRTVRLTVLPGDEANTTTSHGGLLEVDRSFQSVEEAQREHAAKALRQDPVPSNGVVAGRRAGLRVYPLPASPSRKNAVLAAVGAGMIPATMAMLLPMVLGRKKRSLDNVYLQRRYNHQKFS